MGQKINPISLRLEQTNRQFDSCWFNDYNYTNLINKDIKIKSYINLVLNQIKYSSARFFIQNLPNKTKVHVFFLNPKTLRKNVSRVFQLKDSFKKRKTKQISLLQKKNENFQTLAAVKNEVFLEAGRKTQNYNYQLLKKNIFLKNYKNNTNNKAKLLNYFLLNCSSIYFKKKLLNNFYTLEKSKDQRSSSKAVNEVFSAKGASNHISDFSLVEKTSLRNLELKKTKFFKADNKIISLDKTNFNTKLNTKIWNFNTENNKNTYIQLFLRYLLLKKFSLKFNQKLETRNFLFFNFVNFTLLNNKNKFFLVSNFLNLKIHDYKQYLENDIRDNKIKFCNLLAASKAKELYEKKKHLSISKLTPLTKPKKSFSHYFSEAAVGSNGNEAIKTIVKSNKNIPNNTIVSLNSSLNNLNYFFLSLINKQSLKKIHSYFNKSLKNFYTLQNPFFSCLTVLPVNQQTSFGQRSREKEVFKLTSLAEPVKEKSLVFSFADKAKANLEKIKLTKQQKIQNVNSYTLIRKSINNDLIKLVTDDFQILKPLKKKINALTNLETAFKNNLASIHITNQNNKNVYKSNSILANNLKLSTTPWLKNEVIKTSKKKFFFLQNPFFKKHLESQITNTFFSDTAILFFKFSNEKQSAIFLAEEIIYYLEKKVPFFKIKNKLLKEISKFKNPFLKGLKVTCSGRVGGRSKKAQRAKVQVIKYGQTSLHVFSSKIDFASKHAYTVFGLLGVKVWICYN